MHTEVATRDFMDFLRDLVKDMPDKARTKLLELLQTWAYAFKERHRIIYDTYDVLKSDGFDFPEFIEAEAHFDAEMAPEWKDSNYCFHCRVEFGLITRKHHCRNCGEVFCGDCTKKQSVIPKYGFEREVRVCDACYDDLNKKNGGGGGKTSSSTSSRGNSQDATAEKQRKERELQLQEEEELQLAMAISQSEAEFQKQQQRKQTSVAKTAPVQQTRPSSPPPTSTITTTNSDASSELDRYLDRAYWERRQQQQQVPVSAPSAPSPTDSIAATLQNNLQGTPMKQGTVSSQAPTIKQDEAEQFVQALQKQIAAFLTRIHFDQKRGREVSSDAAVQNQFTQLSRANELLMNFIHDADERRNYFEGLQEKLVKLSDAREALDALRSEQAEWRRQQAEEEERQRRAQMAQKLDYMRARKHEYLEMQRQQALQRLEEQQRDMAMRLEQQKAARMQQVNPQMYYPPQQQQQQPGQLPPGAYYPPGGQFQQPVYSQHQPPTSFNQQWHQPGQPPQQYPVDQANSAQQWAQQHYVPTSAPTSQPNQAQPSQVVPGPPQQQQQQPPQQFQYQQQHQQFQQNSPMPAGVVPQPPPEQHQPSQPVAELIQFD